MYISILLFRFLKFDLKFFVFLLVYIVYVFVIFYIGEMLKEKIKNVMLKVNYFLII